MNDNEGRRRVVIESVEPEIDCGRHPAKRTVGETVEVEADIFADGHDALAAELLHRRPDSEVWAVVGMAHLDRDRWRGEFVVERLGSYVYTLRGWTDAFLTWRRGLETKLAARVRLTTELSIGARLVEEAAGRAEAEADRREPQAVTTGVLGTSIAESAQPPEGARLTAASGGGERRPVDDGSAETAGSGPVARMTSPAKDAAWLRQRAAALESLAEELEAASGGPNSRDEGLGTPDMEVAGPGEGHGATADDAGALDASLEARVASLALGDDLAEVATRYPDRSRASRYDRELQVVVEREKARFSAWYEMFPRSASPDPERQGTLRDCIDRLAYIESMSFDVLYLPPIHPIGQTHRKGRNNAPVATPDDPGSPWAIGSEEGGHRSIDPRLGTFDDFHDLVERAAERGIEIAIDLAYQCSPDHPWVREHPEWFRHRPDGSIQYAENPPKKYQDIYPLDFECDDWRGLWEELAEVVRFWIRQGVKIFRVDNPHTKPFRFWEWLIAEIRAEEPETIFLSEAFTRPKVMKKLAKLGFSQSYTYFAWRNTVPELTAYFEEITRTRMRQYFRPNLWPNTPDILTEYLQTGGRPAFMVRLALAAMLGPSYGIYGPAFELGAAEPREPGSEEYMGSEKYQVVHWDLDDPASLREFIARINHVRRDNPALHSNRNLRFHSVDDPQVLCFSKHTDDLSNVVVVAANVDPHHVHAGWVELPVEELRLDASRPYQMHDLLGGGRHLWQGRHNFVQLDPRVSPVQVFRVRHRVRTERDFEYYL